MQDMIGSNSDPLLVRNIEGGNEQTIKDERYNTYDYEWSWTQTDGGGNVVNSSSGDRTLIKKLYFG